MYTVHYIQWDVPCFGTGACLLHSLAIRLAPASSTLLPPPAARTQARTTIRTSLLCRTRIQDHFTTHPHSSIAGLFCGYNRSLLLLQQVSFAAIVGLSTTHPPSSIAGLFCGYSRSLLQLQQVSFAAIVGHSTTSSLFSSLSYSSGLALDICKRDLLQQQRDLLQQQKRPTTAAKETCYSSKRDLRQSLSYSSGLASDICLPNCRTRIQAHCTAREHILQQENTFYSIGYLLTKLQDQDTSSLYYALSLPPSYTKYIASLSLFPTLYCIQPLSPPFPYCIYSLSLSPSHTVYIASLTLVQH